jgi:hypothetical protein
MIRRVARGATPMFDNLFERLGIVTRKRGVSLLGDRAATGGAALRPLNTGSGTPLATVQTAAAEEYDRAVGRAA